MLGTTNIKILRTFQEILSVPSSRVKQSNNKSRNVSKKLPFYAASNSTSWIALMFVDAFQSRLDSNNKIRLAWRPSYLAGQNIRTQLVHQTQTHFMFSAFGSYILKFWIQWNSLWGHPSCCYGRVYIRTQWVGDGVIKQSKLSGNRVTVPLLTKAGAWSPSYRMARGFIPNHFFRDLW
jgi:hypothetical protein